MANYVNKQNYVMKTTDGFPSNPAEGSTLYYVDTGAFYIFYNNLWFLQSHDVTIGNTSENPVNVNIMSDEVEEVTTLYSAVETVTDTPKTISIDTKVTTIDIANYSDDTSVTLTIGELEFEIGNNITTTLEINAEVTDITLESLQSAKIQIIVKGVS